MFNKNKRFLVLSIIFLVLAVAVNAFIIWQSCIPGDESGAYSQPIADVIETGINTVAPGTINESNMESFIMTIRKGIGHFLLFGFDAVVTTLFIYFSCCDTTFYRHYKAILISASVGAFVAIFTEVIQYFVPGRAGYYTDSLLDFGGYALALALTYLIIILILRKKKKSLAK